MKYPRVEPVTDAQTDHYRQGNGKTQATVIPQLPEQFLGFIFHDKERLPSGPFMINGPTSGRIQRHLSYHRLQVNR